MTNEQLANETESNEQGGLEEIRVVEAPSFTFVHLDPIETLLNYQALRLFLRHLAAQDNEPLDNIEKVTGLLRILKPAAQKAAQIIGGQGQGTIGKES